MLYSCVILSSQDPQIPYQLHLIQGVLRGLIKGTLASVLINGPANRAPNRSRCTNRMVDLLPSRRSTKPLTRQTEAKIYPKEVPKRIKLPAVE
jgi:hypothetical protein